MLLTAVTPSAGTGTVDVTVTTAVGTSPVDTAKDSFTCRIRIGRGNQRGAAGLTLRAWSRAAGVTDLSLRLSPTRTDERILKQTKPARKATLSSTAANERLPARRATEGS